MTVPEDPRGPAALPSGVAARTNGATAGGDRPLPSPPRRTVATPSEGAIEDAWRILRNRKWVFLQALILVPLVALVVSLAQDETYTASASLLFREAPSVLETADSEGFDDPSREAATNEELVALPVVAERAALRLRGQIGAQEIERSVTVDSSGEANLVRVEAEAESPQLAASVANAYSQAYIEFRRQADRRQVESAIAVVQSSLDALSRSQRSGDEGRELQSRLEQLRLARSLQTGNAELVQRAQVPTSASSPKTLRNVALGIVLGAMLGFALAALLERVDRRLKSVEELEEIYDLPLLARIPLSRSFAPTTLPGGEELPMGADETEAFRTLRANLRYFNVDEPIRSVLVASPLAGDGKSTIARMLAMTMAAMGDDVVLVEADLHKPGLGAEDGRAPTPGLSSLLSGTNLDEALVEVLVPREASGRRERTLTVLPSGPAPPNPSELLESTRMQSVLRVLEHRFETVVVDSPALSVVSDPLSLVAEVSGVIMVSGLGQTTRDAALDSRRQISLLGGRILGLVANFAEVQHQGGYYYSASRAPAATR